MSYTLNIQTGSVTRDSDGVQVAPAQSVTEPSSLLLGSRSVDLLWAPARIAAVSAQIYWATWHQVFRYPRGE